MRRSRAIALIGVAAVAVAVENYLFFGGSSLPTSSVGDEEDEEYGDERAPDDGDLALAPLENERLARWFASHPGRGRNPFLTRAEAGLTGDSSVPTVPRLAGVLWSPIRRVAWIDGTPRVEDDWVGDHRIERIQRDSVWLRRGEHSIQLVMDPDAPNRVEEWLRDDD